MGAQSHCKERLEAPGMRAARVRVAVSGRLLSSYFPFPLFLFSVVFLCRTTGFKRARKEDGGSERVDEARLTSPHASSFHCSPSSIAMYP
jgi:hypothetical protein